MIKNFYLVVFVSVIHLSSCSQNTGQAQNEDSEEHFV